MNKLMLVKKMKNTKEVDKEDIDEDQLNNSKDSTYRPETQNASSSEDD